MRARILKATAAAASAALLVSACSSGSPSGGAKSETFKVGLIMDVTGSLSALYSPDASSGVQAALKTLAASHQASHIAVQTFDAQSTAQGAASAVQSAVSAHARALIIMEPSGQETPMVPILKQVKLPVFASAPLSILLEPTPEPWYFTLTAPISQFADYLVQEASDAVGGSLASKRIAWAGIDQPFVNELSAAVQSDATKLGAKWLTTEKRAPAGTSFGSQADVIASSKPDVVIGDDSSSGAALISSGLQSSGYLGPIVFGAGVASGAFFDKAGAPNIRAEFDYRLPQTVPSLQAALQKYGLSGSGTWLSAAFVLTNFLSAAVDKCAAGCTTADLTKTVESMPAFNAPGDITLGPVQYTPSDHGWLTKVGFYRTTGPSKSPAQTGPLIELIR
jgi:hypothetical protein